jgi:hypothetical protein
MARQFGFLEVSEDRVWLLQAQNRPAVLAQTSQAAPRHYHQLRALLRLCA